MLNKLLPRTPLGIALTAVSVILAVSPEARRMTRRAAVKGISATLGLFDQLKGATATTRDQFNDLMVKAKQADDHRETLLESAPRSYNVDVEPVPFSPIDDSRPPFKQPYNVINDDVLKPRPH
jgi:hypothetical protein